MTPMNDYIKYMDGCFFYFFQNYYIFLDPRHVYDLLPATHDCSVAHQ